MQRGGGEGGEQAAGQDSGDVGPKDAEEVLAAIHAGPHQHAEEIDVHQEYAQEDGERGGFGQEEGGEAHGLRGQYLVIAAVGKERVPFEDHEEAHHGHGERNEHVADGDEVPSGEGERAEQEHEEGAGGGQDAEGLNDSGFGLSLRRERLGIEEAAEEVAHQGAEDAGCSRTHAPVPYNLDTGVAGVVSDCGVSFSLASECGHGIQPACPARRHSSRNGSKDKQNEQGGSEGREVEQADPEEQGAGEAAQQQDRWGADGDAAQPPEPIASRRISQTISPPVAPSAMRIPISPVRRVTA